MIYEQYDEENKFVGLKLFCLQFEQDISKFFYYNVFTALNFLTTKKQFLQKNYNISLVKSIIRNVMKLSCRNSANIKRLFEILGKYGSSDSIQIFTAEDEDERLLRNILHLLDCGELKIFKLSEVVGM